MKQVFVSIVGFLLSPFYYLACAAKSAFLTLTYRRGKHVFVAVSELREVREARLKKPAEGVALKRAA